jgi:hypothetical protein
MWAHSHFFGVLYQFICLEYSKWVVKLIQTLPSGVFSLIDNPKANRSFFAFFEPSTRFKNHQGLLSLIRLSPSFVVLNLTVKMGMRPW